MANTRFTFANNQFLTGQLNWLTQTFRVVLINVNAYAVQPAVHQTLADVPAAAQIAISAPLTGATAVGGVARASDLTISSVTGPAIGAYIIFHDTGSASSSELICYIDTAIGLPANPQGSNVVIHWDTGPNGIFTL
jgi:hypothetical protein